MEDLRIAARHELWRRGDLRFKFHATQKKIHEVLGTKRRLFLLCSRRLGKSFTLLCSAISYAIRNPGARLSYAAPTAKDAAAIVNDLAVQILADCPEDIRPEWAEAAREFRFQNSAVLRISGVNAEHLENLRGRAAHEFYLDECGSMSNLQYLIDSVVAPTLLTTKGRMILASTPPPSPGHDMFNVVKGMEKRGEVVKFTLLDAPHIDYEEKFDTLERCGEDPVLIPDILAGKVPPQTTTALREYFVEFVTDAETAVVPEFTAQVRAEIVKYHERPPYFDTYVAMDPGFADKTGVLFGYWDFVQKKLVIQDELLLHRATTDDIGEQLKKKELELWNGRVPLARVSDIDLRLIKDLQIRHGIFFSKANRQDSLGAIDLLRTMIRRREMVIDPKCTALVRQLTNATWNKKATDFERSAEDGHQDALAALKYMCRSVVRDRNPYPSWYGAPGFDTHGGNRGGGAPKTIFSDTPLGRRLAKKWG